MVTIIPPEGFKSCHIPEITSNNGQFSEFTRKVLFPEGKFLLVNIVEREHFHPLFTFQDLTTGLEFTVECLFRLGFIVNGFHPVEYPFIRKERHFIILGLGGTPERPNQVFLLPFRNCHRNVLKKRHLFTKAINSQSSISSSQLWENSSLQTLVRKNVA